MAAPARGAVYGPIATPYTNTCVGERGSTVVALTSGESTVEDEVPARARC